MQRRMLASVSGRSATERLSPADASNMLIDAPGAVNAFLVAGILAPGGPVNADGTVDIVALRGVLADRLAATPRLTQRVVRTRHHLMWETVAVDLARHVREIGAVDGVAGLQALCARLIVTPLIAGRPLWELIVASGVASHRAAIVFRIHHAIADGLAAVRLAEELLDPVATGVEPAASHPVAGASTAGAGAEMAGRPSWLTTAFSGLERTAAILRPTVRRSVLLGPLSPHRSIAFVDTDLDTLAAGADAVDATLNDALLASVASGVRHALSDRNAPIPDSLPTSVPVALPPHGRSGNAVGVMLVPLPLRTSDCAERLRQVAQLTQQRKADARSRGTLELTRTKFGARLLARLARHQHLIGMFVTNVPGPRRRLSLGGAPLERMWPVTALQGNVRLGVSALSYDAGLDCVVHADVAGIDAQQVAAAMTDEFARIARLGNARSRSGDA